MIYLIVDEECEFCKIGYSQDPKKRLNMLQTGNSSNLLLHYVIKGTIETEKHLHKKFEKYHSRGEWFTYNQEINDYFEKTQFIDFPDFDMGNNVFIDYNLHIFLVENKIEINFDNLNLLYYIGAISYLNSMFDKVEKKFIMFNPFVNQKKEDCYNKIVKTLYNPTKNFKKVKSIF